MLTFKEHFNFIAKIKNLFSFVLEKIKDLLELSFGQKKSIKIDVSKMSNQILSENMDENMDLKSHVGYYAEYTTAYNLSLLIQKNGGNLTTTRSQPSNLKKRLEQKKKTILNLDVKPTEKKKIPSELERMDSAGALLSKVIFQDVILKGNDYTALQFDIELTGDSEKGSSKADLILTVGKMDKKEIVDRINASLKAYKSSNINLSNSTFISFIKTLFYDGDVGKNTEAFIAKFAKDYGSSSDLEKLYNLQNIIGTKMSKGLSKESARKFAKTVHGEVIEIISKIFTTYYKNNKEKINNRMLKVLGFDGQDDFYAAIGKTGKQKVVSSRKSKEMQEMLEELQNGFELTMERNGKTNNANIYFKSIDGTKIINQANITFADTGGKKPQGKTNAFVNIGKFAN
jgi:hypothetical protein